MTVEVKEFEVFGELARDVESAIQLQRCVRGPEGSKEAAVRQRTEAIPKVGPTLRNGGFHEHYEECCTHPTTSTAIGGSEHRSIHRVLQGSSGLLSGRSGKFRWEGVLVLR